MENEVRKLTPVNSSIATNRVTGTLLSPAMSAGWVQDFAHKLLDGLDDEDIPETACKKPSAKAYSHDS